MNLYIKETSIEVREDDKRYGIFESDVYESWFDTSMPMSRILKHLMKDYGRIIEKVYVGDENLIHVGYVFQKRVKYEDSKDTYILETWITFHEQKENKEVKITYHYATI